MLFSFKQDLILKLRKNGFWKRKKKGTSVNSKNKFPNIEVLNLLGNILLVYNGDMEIFSEQINIIKNKYPKYNSFI